MKFVLVSAFLLTLVMGVGCSTTRATAGVAEFKNNMLYVDGESQPQLYGAEVQYFRLRGGPGRNVPRERVIELWNKALDRLAETKANSISFYIPWDFHEYAPGKFDFDGTVDEDGDGKPDYPSRDLRTWLKLVEQHGFKNILVRPGPYINAEWGYLGFGAVPLWFNDKYPDSHMQNPKGQRTTLFSYTNPDFLRLTKNWMTVLYKQVLAPYIGPGRPVTFLQLDNETNFQWQSLYANDFSPRAMGLYQDFLKDKFSSIEKLNAAHHRTWRSFKDVKAPAEYGQNLAEDQDWYRYQDESIHTYLQKIRKIWESLGVKEPQVVFTLAESYNAAEHGLLPHYLNRNDPGKTGMMTVNLYPKTYDNHDGVLLNQPFKADHDVKAADAANDLYFGKKVEWVMGPEIQGGWWRGTDVTAEARQQTYLTTLGHGLKGLYIYYYNEGDNWEYDWAKNQLQPYYVNLRKDPRYKAIPADQLPDDFWGELDGIVADKVFANWNSRWILSNGGTQPKELYFDAPLGADAEPRAPYQLLKEIGEKIIAPHGRFLAGSTELVDPVCFLKDDASNVPSNIPGIDSGLVHSYWAGGLIAYMLQAGVNPRMMIWGITPEADYATCRLIVYQDTGGASAPIHDLFKKQLAAGNSVISFIGKSVLGAVLTSGTADSTCQRLSDTPVELNGVKCKVGSGSFYQVANAIYADFNSDLYASLGDVPQRRMFFDSVIAELNIIPQIRIAGGGDRTVAWGRKGADGKKLWVTVKTGLQTAFTGRVQWTQAVPTQTYAVSRLMEGSMLVYKGQELIDHGFAAGMKPNGSDAFLIEPISAPEVGVKHTP